MNIQALMKQAQSLQNDMLKEKEAIDKKDFEGESSLVKVVVKGDKRVVKVDISKDSELSQEDLEILEDMIVVAMNDAFSKVDQELEEKMKKFSNGLPGLF